jgi:hypothetical protein
VNCGALLPQASVVVHKVTVIRQHPVLPWRATAEPLLRPLLERCFQHDPGSRPSAREAAICLREILAKVRGRSAVLGRRLPGSGFQQPAAQAAAAGIKRCPAGRHAGSPSPFA